MHKIMHIDYWGYMQILIANAWVDHVEIKVNSLALVFIPWDHYRARYSIYTTKQHHKTINIHLTS